MAARALAVDRPCARLLQPDAGPGRDRRRGAVDCRRPPARPADARPDPRGSGRALLRPALRRRRPRRPDRSRARQRINAAQSLGEIFGLLGGVCLDLSDSHTMFLPPPARPGGRTTAGRGATSAIGRSSTGSTTAATPGPRACASATPCWRSPAITLTRANHAHDLLPPDVAAAAAAARRSPSSATVPAAR